jgi:hypothetical protein
MIIEVIEILWVLLKVRMDPTIICWLDKGISVALRCIHSPNIKYILYND